MAALTDDQLKDIAQAQTLGGPQPGDTYRHYKGGLYTIVARSLMEETLTPLVTYRSEANGTCWTRTIANFTEWVVTPAKADGMQGAGPRFRKVEVSGS